VLAASYLSSRSRAAARNVRVCCVGMDNESSQRLCGMISCMGIYADITYHLCLFECMKSVDRFQVSQNGFIYENTRHTSICILV